MKREETNENGTAPAIPLTQKRPGMSLGINKRAVFVTVGGIIGVFALLFAGGFSDSKREFVKATESPQRGKPSENVNTLPDDYSKIKPPKVAPTLKPLKEMRDEKILEVKETPEEKLAREELLKKRRRAIEAREANVEFVNLSRARDEFLGGKESRASLDPLAIEGGGGSSNLNPRDEENRQDEKDSFLKRRRDSETTLKEHLTSPPSPYTLQAGSLIPGLLLTGINSDLPGQISGQVSQNIYNSVTGNHLLIPQATKVIGEYDSRIVYGQERVLIVWTRLILPNGESISLESMPGVDLSGYAGLSDKVNHHYLKLLSGVVFGSMLGAGAQVAHGNERFGNPDFGELALEGAAQNINQAGQEITRKNLGIQPTIEIRPGSRFNIFVTKDMVLKPYKS